MTTIVRTVETCRSVPSQWDAWTSTGQYLYLRYRFGIGTVDAYDSPDETTWPDHPLGTLARFGESNWDGTIELEEFCERAGLVLAPDAVQVPWAEYDGRRA
ncbi:hypothetical protein QMK19_34205 [Streptomyces sp. H10-C2]|uniref:hypothetical protein n=1 Tax=unclassified Streptomyces TaxID=2593676 RepID=UPI0024BB4B87|nr:MULTISPECIES: hypothetical protein [unclassified Streptomyces]MDJ0345690.1 hypothetical protein [Streptomyces sp. PH10-H1]MDJ0374542.1 hypothetical protein [Streptomyces sp. H10-C2]